MLRNMVTSVLLYEHIRTTKKRAQVVKALVDRVLTIGKRERADLAIRKINQIVFDPNACRKVLEVFKKRYAKRSSGFSRVVPVGSRKGDGAMLADLILLDAAEPEEVQSGKLNVKSASKRSTPSLQ